MIKRDQKSSKTSASGKYRKGPKLSRRAMKEFGPGEIDIIFCPEGDEVYYYKSWHHNLRRYHHLKETKPVSFKLCPFHQMKKNRQWEGEIKISNVPDKYKLRVLKTAENMSREAHRRDPMHRILNIKQAKKEIVIYTSENQLAQKIAKKISQSFKTYFSKLKISRAKGSDMVLIVMEWVK